MVRATLVVVDDAGPAGEEVEDTLETQAGVTRSAVNEDERRESSVHTHFSVVQMIPVYVRRIRALHARTFSWFDSVVGVVEVRRVNEDRYSDNKNCV